MMAALISLNWLVWLATPMAWASGHSGHPSPNNDAYLKNLQLAQAKVERIQTQSRQGPGALSASRLALLSGRYYQIGDSWTVASWLTQKNGDPYLSEPSLFRYEVVDVKNGPNPEVRIQVTQVDAPGFTVVDPQVKSVDLRLQTARGLKQIAKKYRFIEPPNSGVSSLELYALDAPDTLTAPINSIEQIPELPTQIQTAAAKLGWHPQPQFSKRIESDDFFGRPVETIWQKGDLWPAYLKTVNSVSLLTAFGQ